MWLQWPHTVRTLCERDEGEGGDGGGVFTSCSYHLDTPAHSLVWKSKTLVTDYPRKHWVEGQSKKFLKITSKKPWAQVWFSKAKCSFKWPRYETELGNWWKAFGQNKSPIVFVPWGLLSGCRYHQSFGSHQPRLYQS